MERGIEVLVQQEKEEQKIVVKAEESVMDALIREGYYISAVCGGKGRCGKCKVKVLEGNALISSADKDCFSEQEIAEGWRLSCTLYPQMNLKIALFSFREMRMEAVSEYQTMSESEETDRENESGFLDAIAIDIGTTTIAFQLLNGASEKERRVVTRINSQRKYGADVISRIQASTGGKKEVLQECIREDLRQGIRELLQEEVIGSKVGQIVISCNTTMSHLLLGYDCDSLGVYPFTPVNIDVIRGSARNIIGASTGDSQWEDAQVIILPGISTYVGGDIVAGLYACDVFRSDKICLLVDLGTNGEMALGNRERILVTSTAAGPAFEGGNITWGVGSIAGAICSVQLEKSVAGEVIPDIQTIWGEAPIGICGTGVIECIAQLLREDILDETGLLDEEYFESGFPLARRLDGEQIVLTQKDIRELQLAKAAIRAGMETLLLRYGIEKEQVAAVYLAGGFGYRLDVDKAIAIGMLPEEFRDRTKAVGNSSLAGAVRYLKNACQDESLQELVQKAEEVSLSADVDFQELYMDAMMFE